MATYARHYCTCGSPIKPSKKSGQWWTHVDKVNDTHAAKVQLFEMRAETSTEATLHMVSA